MSCIGIMVATDEELEAIKNKFNSEKVENVYGIDFEIGEIEGKKCILTKSGIGKVNAARTAQLLIDRFNAEKMINIGVAGAINDELNIGDILLANSVIQYDFDMTAFGHNQGYVPGIGEKIKNDEILLNSFKNILSKVDEKGYQIMEGDVATGDRFCTEIEQKNMIFSKFNADCVEMEGAAIAQVCKLSDIPLLMIKSISDSPNGNNNIDYDENINLASERVSDMIYQYFKYGE